MRRRGKYAALLAGAALIAGTPTLAEAEVRPTCAVAAHRGDWSATQTENGLPAMRSAIARGADYLEMDVRTTADQKFVLMHDWRVDRTTNGTGAVATKTLAQVKRLRLNDGSQVPTLHQVLTTAKPSGVHLLIELKSMSGRATFSRFAQKLRDFGISRVRVMSKYTSHLATMESIAPRIRKGIVTSTRLTAKQVAPYDSVVIDYTQLTAAWLDSMPYPVFAWTLNDEVGWSSSYVDRLAAVITDAPALFMPWRETGCAA